MAVIATILRRLRTDESGFGLAEVLVSIFVVGVTMLPAVRVLASGNHAGATAQNIQVASEVGTRALEELRARSWTQLKAGAVVQTGAFPTSGEVGSRVAGGAYVRPSGAAPEPLVAFAMDPTAPADVEDVEVGTGKGRRTVRVHRIVSWRTESCPLVSVSEVVATVDALAAKVAGLTETSGVLPTLLGGDGTGGRLAEVLSSEELTRTTLGGLNALTLGLLGTQKVADLRAALDAVDANARATRDALQPLRTALDALRTQLQSLSSQLTSGSSGGIVGGRIDPCQLPDDAVVPSIGELEDISDALDTLTPQLSSLSSTASSAVSTLSAITTEILAGTLSSSNVTTLTGQAGALLLPDTTLAVSSEVGAGSGGAGIEVVAESGDVTLRSVVERQTTRAQQFVSALAVGHPSNTIRVTVAVQFLETPGDVGPKKPIWFSTVITNPKARVL